VRRQNDNKVDGDGATGNDDGTGATDDDNDDDDDGDGAMGDVATQRGRGLSGWVFLAGEAFSHKGTLKPEAFASSCLHPSS